MIVESSARRLLDHLYPYTLDERVGQGHDYLELACSTHGLGAVSAAELKRHAQEPRRLGETFPRTVLVHHMEAPNA